MKTTRKTSAQCMDDAKTAGRAAAGTDQTNPYKPATQCWMLFNLERSKAEKTNLELRNSGKNHS